MDQCVLDDLLIALGSTGVLQTRLRMRASPRGMVILRTAIAISGYRLDIGVRAQGHQLTQRLTRIAISRYRALPRAANGTAHMRPPSTVALARPLPVVW
jgi:hypothetical protein